MTAKQTADKLEQKRLEHERTRLAQRAKFEEQMRQLEAQQLAEEKQLLSGDATSAPTTSVPSSGSPVVEKKLEPIGPPREVNGVGAKSMPASRRTSGHAGTFGMEKLSLSVMSQKERKEDEDVDAEGAQSTFICGDIG